MCRSQQIGAFLIAGITLTALSAASFAADFALVVGVNACPRYTNDDGIAFPTLGGAEVGADQIAHLLQHRFNFPEGNIRVLKGERADYETIKAEFVAVAKAARPADQFVFYFAGHGTQLPDDPRCLPPFDEADGWDEALCPSDALRRFKGHNLIVDDELAGWLAAVPARQITVVLDCCHAGTAVKGDPGDNIKARYLAPVAARSAARQVAKHPWGDLQSRGKGPGKTIIALYACGPEQPAIERRFPELQPQSQRGQFTQFLVDAIADGKFTVAEIAAFAKREIDKWAAESDSRRRAGEQSPAFEPLENANWPLFATKR
jgi:hypothetical protein